MSNLQVNARGSISIIGNDKNDTDSVAETIPISGSNYISLLMNVPTGSWTTLPTGSNADFLIGIFINQDVTSSVYIALGNTSNTASILTPNVSSMCILSYSGSANVYAYAIGANSPVQLSYKMVSMN